MPMQSVRLESCDPNRADMARTQVVPRSMLPDFCKLRKQLYPDREVAGHNLKSALNTKEMPQREAKPSIEHYHICWFTQH